MSQEDKTELYKTAYEKEKKKNDALDILFEQKTYELYKANQQLKDQQKTIIKSEKLASIGRLAAGFAHEINNPLTFVSSNMEILSCELKQLSTDSFDQTELLEIIADISDGIERIKSIVNNVNNYARTKESERSEVNINQAVLSSLHLIKNRIINKIKLQTELVEVPVFYGNLNEIKQAVLNLLINALDAMDVTYKSEEEKSLTVRTELDYVYKHIILKISDTGSGIDDSVQLSIFDPFYSTKEVGKGSGLGLYVCHEIITAHGGSIDVESEVGIGTTFTIRIPIDLRTRKS